MAAEVCTELCVPVPWGEIRGRVWGPDLGRPVLCLHGWADNCGSFNTLVPLLPRDGRYVAVDLAGHVAPPIVLLELLTPLLNTWRTYAELQTVSLQLEKFSIIGHSMGADIAGMFSALYPERVDALVLLDAYGFFPTDSKEVCRVMRQGMEQMIQFEKETEGKRRVYTYEKAVERLLTANPALSEQSVHILLERGLVQVEGGFVFSRDLRVNFKNTSRLSLEQSLEMQSRIQADVLVVLAEAGFDKIFSQPEEFTSALLQCFMDKNHKVVTVPGDHHIHLNKPEVIAPFVSDFLQTKASTNQHKL